MPKKPKSPDQNKAKWYQFFVKLGLLNYFCKKI
jgi:hypothetical protein